MTARLINDIAEVIREIDGDNKLSAHELSWGVVSDPRMAHRFAGVRLGDLTAFVERTNPDKTMGAGALAELIVAEFDLNQVS
jgi:hypothetical protein